MRRPHHLIFILLVMLSNSLAAQDFITLSGIITDLQTRQPLPHVSVAAGAVGTVTNDHGRFTLKVKPEAKVVTFSLIGYQSRNVHIERDGQRIDIALQPLSVTLNEVVVRNLSAENLVYEAIRKFHANYSKQPSSYKGFYREVIQKRRQYLSISEAVVEMYKTSYDNDITFDAVSILRGRRMMNMKSSDTLAVKVLGGPTLPIFADVVKNRDFLFYPDDLQCFAYAYVGDEQLDDRPHYVVRMSPVKAQPYALFFANLYIDKQSLAISRADLHLDMRNRARATSTMLLHRPAGLRFTPLELTFSIFYRSEGGTTHLNYIRNEMRFKCDWHRRLFASAFTVVSEFVVTDILPAAKTIRGRDTFKRNDNLYDNVDLFSEPDFWGPDNIIEPTEPLNRAVERLRRSVERTIGN